MAFTLLNNFQLLDTVVLTGRRKVFVKDVNSPFSNAGVYSYVSFNIENASAQPINNNNNNNSNQLLLADGIREYEAYTIYTSTLMKSSEETTTELADQVQLNGIYGLNWFTVVKSKKHSMTSNGSQYEVTVVKYPNVT